MKRCPRCSDAYPAQFAFCPRDGVTLRSAEDPPPDPLVGQTLAGAYKILARIGAGAMGAVYRGEHLRTGRPIAVKVLASVPAGSTAAARIEREARAAARLDHPGIVGVLDFGFAEDGRAFLVLELAKGRTLKEVLREQGALAPERVVALGVKLAEALAAAHEGGVVHRDVKPANLLVQEGRPGELSLKILDFGVSRLSGPGEALTEKGAVLGTPFYMPPEQARGDPVDERADVYAAGVVLYEALTGTVPFHGDTPLAVLAKILSDRPTSIREKRPEVPGRLADVVERAMSRDPADRHPGAAALAVALAACLEDAQRAAPDAAPVVPRRTSRGEVRVVTVLLAELDALHDPGHGDLAEMVSAAYDAFEASALAEGGHVERLLGHRAFAVFGLAASLGDEPVRAVRAAMAARAGLARSGIAARLAIGTGRVTSGGTTGTGITGEAVSTASRLLHQASSEGVFVDRATLRAVRAAFETRAVTGGIQEVVRERAGELRGGAAAEEAAIVGREAEIGALAQLLRDVLGAGRPGAAVVVGPPGVGKTRVLQAFASDLDALPMRVLLLEGHANALSAESPHALLGDALRRRAGLSRGDDGHEASEKLLSMAYEAVRGPDAEEVARLVGVSLGISTGSDAWALPLRANPEVLRNRIRWATARLFSGWALRQPVVLVAEDLQWADAASLDQIEDLLSSIEGPLLFVGAGRPELRERFPRFPGEQARRIVIDVPPLSSAQIDQLVESLLGGAPPAELGLAIQARAEGNPQFVEEVLQGLRDREVLVRSDGRWTLRGPVPPDSLPVGVEAALQARIDRLPADEREALKKAAVVGAEFWTEALVALGVEDADDLLARLSKRDLLLRSNRSRVAGAAQHAFRQGLLREVAYAMLPRRERAGLHGQVASWLREHAFEDAAVLARHDELAGNASAASESYAAAARASLDEFANAEALSHARRSAGLAADDRGRLRALELGEEALRRLERTTERREALGEIATLADRIGTDASRALGAFLRGRERLEALVLHEAEPLLDAAATHAGAAGEKVRESRARVLLGRAQALAGRGAAAIAEVRRALAIAESLADPVLQAASLYQLAVVLLHVGDPGEGLGAARRGLEVSRASGQLDLQASCLSYLGNCLMQLGRLDESHAAFVEAARIASQVGLLDVAAIAEMNQAFVHLRRKDPVGALEPVRRAAATAAKQGELRARALCHLARAFVEAAQPREEPWEEGLPIAAEAERAFGDSASGQARLWAWIASVACRAAARDTLGLPEAEASLLDALEAEAIVPADHVWALGALAEARRVRGDAAGAAEARSRGAITIREMLRALRTDEDRERVAAIPYYAQMLG